MEPFDRRFYIDDWLIDPRLHRIFGEEGTILIEPKVMQVLTCLAAHPGEVLDRDTLLDDVWGDTVVTDHVLTRSISELRKVFGDDARNPSVIETIPKTGYRLIASVKVAGDGLSSPLPGNSVHSAPAEVHLSPTFVTTQTAPTRGLHLSLMVGLLALVLMASAWLVLQPKHPIQPLPSQLLTSLPGVESNPLFSPDGQRVAFTWQQDPAQPHQLFVKLIGAETPLQLTHDTTRAYLGAWSPDGSQIAFRRYGPDQCGIYVVSALGGPERKLIDCSASRFSLDWSPMGTWLAASYTDSTARGLVLINPETGTSRRLTTVEDRGFDRLPRFSPDGAYLAFVRTAHQSMEDLFLVPTDGAEPPRRLTTDQRHIPGFSWRADGETLVFSSNRAGNYKLWRIPATGGEPVWLAEAGAYDPGGVSIAPDGRMVYAEWDYEINIWKAPLSPATPEVPASERWIASSRWDFHPGYSPDGTRIAFTSNRMGSPNLWVSQADGSDPLRLTDFEHTFIGLPSWSPDGQQIAFDVHSDDHTVLFVIDAEGGQPQRLSQPGGDHRNPTWSRNGKWIYFASNRSGSWQLWKKPVAGGEAIPITKDGGYYGIESADGATFYFSRYGTPGLWQMPAQGGAAKLVLESLATSHWGNWTLGPDGVYFLQSQSNVPRLQRYDPTTGTLTEVVKLPPGVLGHQPGLSISPDGQWLLFANADRVESDLMLVSPAPEKK